jgi:hypothetical protein
VAFIAGGAEMLTNRRSGLESTVAIADRVVRVFLAEVGLPHDHLLFAASDPLPRFVQVGGVERQLLRVGDGGLTDEFCVDCQTGELVSFNRADSTVWHVNRSVQEFASCLQAFSDGLPYGTDDADPEELEEQAGRLGEVLTRIDPTVMDDDPGYWHTVLGDVAIGDYAQD